MDTLTAQTLVFGLAVIAFAGFASYMALRQTEREGPKASESSTLL